MLLYMDSPNTCDSSRSGGWLGLRVTEFHSSNLQIVREVSIPEPWRERFLQASIGSTRLEAAPYLHDLEKFVHLWTQEIQHLEAHRSAVDKYL